MRISTLWHLIINGVSFQFLFLMYSDKSANKKAKIHFKIAMKNKGIKFKQALGYS